MDTAETADSQDAAVADRPVDGAVVQLPADDARENVIEIEHLSKLYKDFWGRPKVRALDDLNLTIKRGEVFGLLGPNGSGKSTTIKLLLGLIFPTSGRASIFGYPIGHDEIKNRIGFIPEESYFYKFLDGEETLRFYGKLFKLSRKELDERVPMLLDTVGLDKKARKRKLREYSKGMARRIGLAQALINDPDLILLDEPTTGLDPDRHAGDEGPDRQPQGAGQKPLSCVRTFSPTSRMFVTA